MHALRPAVLPEEVMLRRVISVPEAAKLRGISEDTFRRRHGDLVLKLSERRRGVRLSDVLALDGVGEPVT